ncbi:MAG TPA: polysaccharide deacetylase family protein [Clostridia bacterium]
MSFKKWIITFFSFILLTGIILSTFNVTVDPFGVFGDPVFNWYSYDFTNNPRASKIAYIDKHHDEFDSYIVGCSKTSSLSTDKLNSYFKGSKFFNMIMYGGDMYDIEKTVSYLVDNYKVKNLVLNIGLEEGANYNKNKDTVKDYLHSKVTGSSSVIFYGRYLFANPEYAYTKLKKYMTKGYLPDAYSVFDEKTGAYNKIVRDREAIGDIDEFLKSNDEFNSKIDPDGKKIPMSAMDQSASAIKRIKEQCEAKGINFMLIASPVFYKEVLTYDKNELKEYWKKIADVTDFWDFSGYNSVSFEPRYYYDPLHFRNSVGDMALAYIFNDKSIYIPQDFGHKTTKENVVSYAEKVFDYNKNAPKATESYSTGVPILMYHHISEDIKDKDTTVTPEVFKSQMAALKQAGFNTILSKDLVDYVNDGKELPRNPVMITFDDGYKSIYQYAYPILKELHMKATSSIIGISAGKNKYKDTDVEIIPHFDYNAAREMYLSGVMDFQSHSYSMHDNLTIEKNGRENALLKKGESEKDYISLFKKDYIKSREEMEKNIGNQIFAYFYPHGDYSVLSEVLLKEMGNKISVSTKPGSNTLIKGLPQSLYALKRINALNDLSGKELINKIESYKK